MVVVLVFLLGLAVSGIAFLGIHAVQLRGTIAQLNAEVAAQRTRFDNDLKESNEVSVSLQAKYQGVVKKYKENVDKWNDYGKSLKEENQRLSKWKNVADADAKAAELERTAQAILEKANIDASNLVSAAQQRANELRANAE